jgi:threonine dehydrogenase-like Zn-dependent dehydrogenase
VLVGLAGKSVTIPRDTLFSFRRQAVIGAYGSEPQHIPELVRLTERGRLDLSASLSATLPLSEAPHAVERLEKKVGNPIRIVLLPSVAPS